MAAKSNQEIERHYFELFRRIYQLPNGQVTYGHKPGPDIIIDGERTLGIEVTNLYLERGQLPESEQKQRKIREDILKKAHRMYMDKGGKNEINFSFNESHPIRDSRKVIRKIVEVICRLERREDFKPKGYRISNYFSDIPELGDIFINQKISSNPQWRIFQIHTHVKTMSVDGLEQILRDKEKKAENYKICDAYWLLVVIDSFDPAQEQVIPEKILNGEVKLASDIYERKIVFQTPQDYLIEF